MTMSQGAQQVKDNGFDARFILVEAVGATAEAKTLDLYGSVVTDLTTLRAAVFELAAGPTAEPGDGDVPMEDGTAS